MRLFRKEIGRIAIYNHKLENRNMFVGLSYVTLTIVTKATVVIYKNIFGNISFKIKKEQRIPLVKHPFYDGEYSTNKQLTAYAKEEYGLMEDWIDANYQKIQNAVKEYYPL